MICRHCQKPIHATDKFCPHCGRMQHKSKKRLLLVVGLAISLFLLLFFLFPFPEKHVSNNHHLKKSSQQVPLTEEQLRIQLIEEAQKTVYTIYSTYNQGSAFLYDNNGSVITNAHVVEGSLDVSVKTIEGKELDGKVIGYSNEIDVALIHVPDLIGIEPFPLEKEKESKVGTEVIALGTPLGLENTATFGYLTGVNRTFNIPPHTFEDVYQISAPIEPGNSGGPLLSIQEEKIIAINSAKRIDSDNIAFSIPLYQVTFLADKWAENPMSDTDIVGLFYDEEGNYYYELLWSLFEHYYFDGGYYLDDEDYHHYWMYDDDDELWKQYYYDWYDEYDGSNDDYWDDDYWDDDYWDDDYWDDDYWDDDPFDDDWYDDWDDDWDDDPTDHQYWYDEHEDFDEFDNEQDDYFYHPFDNEEEIDY